MKYIALLAGLPLALLLLSFPSPASGAQASEARDSDAQAITQVVTDYARAFYDVQPALLEKSLHTDLAKYGFYRRSADEEYRGMAMTYEEAHALAGSLNKEGALGEDLTQTVTILDQLDQTAAAKLEAVWGVDYLHLAKYDGEWKILQVIWQSHVE